MENKVTDNSFAQLLATLNGGASLDDLGRQLAKLVAAVQETGKPGSITHKLTIRPASKGAGETVLVSDDISAKLPRRDRAPQVFFPTADHGLSRQNPIQTHMEFRTIESADPAPTTSQPTAKEGGAL
jgi:hypothetical protein